MIKTITLTPGEVNSVEFSQRYPYFYIKNFSTSDVYASIKKFIFVADEDEVTKIPAGTTGIVYGTLASEYVNILCENSAKIEIVGAFEGNINFNRKIIVGGDSGTSEAVDAYSKTEIDDMLSEKADNSDVEEVSNTVNTHINNASIHMTADEKEKLAGLENYNDLQVRINTSSIGLSRKNLLKNTTGTKTESGALFTVNADGSVTAKRTETSESNSYYLINKISLKKGKYIFTGGNSDDRNIPYILIYTYKSDNTYIGAISGNVVFEVMDESMKYGFNINYPTGNSDEVTFYPMLRYADVADDTYAPYVDDLQTQINNIVARLTALEG